MNKWDMVLTDLLYGQCKLLHNRYELIRADNTSLAMSTDDTMDAASESKQYTTFLKALERKVCPDGFLDSKRLTNTYSWRKRKSDITLQTNTKKKSLPANAGFVIHSQKEKDDYQRKITMTEAVLHKKADHERLLSNHCRKAKHSKENQNTIVQQLQQHLIQVQKVNDKKINLGVTESRNREEKLRQKLIREKARLVKVHADSEEICKKVQLLRHKLKEDSYQLAELKRKHYRLLQSGEHSVIIALCL